MVDPSTVLDSLSLLLQTITTTQGLTVRKEDYLPLLKKLVESSEHQEEMMKALLGLEQPFERLRISSAYTPFISGATAILAMTPRSPFDVIKPTRKEPLAKPDSEYCEVCGTGGLRGLPLGRSCPYCYRWVHAINCWDVELGSCVSCSTLVRHNIGLPPGPRLTFRRK